MAKQQGDTAPLEVADAVARILAEVRALGAVKRPLLDAYNSVLAVDAVAPVTLPPWDNSAMDEIGRASCRERV